MGTARVDRQAITALGRRMLTMQALLAAQLRHAVTRPWPLVALGLTRSPCTLAWLRMYACFFSF